MLFSHWSDEYDPLKYDPLKTSSFWWLKITLSIDTHYLVINGYFSAYFYGYLDLNYLIKFRGYKYKDSKEQIKSSSSIMFSLFKPTNRISMKQIEQGIREVSS